MNIIDLNKLDRIDSVQTISEPGLGVWNSVKLILKDGSVINIDLENLSEEFRLFVKKFLETGYEFNWKNYLRDNNIDKLLDEDN